MTIPSHNTDWSEALVRDLPEGIVTIDKGGQILFINESAERISGWSRTEAVGRSINDVFPLSSSNGKLLEQLSYATASLPPVNILTRSGKEITLAIKTADLKLPESVTPETVLLIRDVTAEDAVYRLRSYFLANISHEFRTPLSALKASVELLLEGLGDYKLDETLELVKSIHFSVTGLQTLIDNLLESVSIEAGRFRIRRQLTDLRKLVTEAAMLMKPLLERRNQNLDVTMPDNLSKVRVDPMRITEVLTNLISNASKYGPIDQPIGVLVAMDQDVWIKVSVSDHGPGITSDDKTNLFHRFVRTTDNDKAQYGIGLGLSVVKSIIESHGGAVGVDDRPGGGSVFWFTIPVEEP